MRERFAHHYGEMDLKIIYNTAVDDVPTLNDFLKKEFEYLFEKNNNSNSEEDTDSEEDEI